MIADLFQNIRCRLTTGLQSYRHERDFSIYLSGVGKTHLAIGSDIEEIHESKRFSLITMRELVSLLKTEKYVRWSQLQLKRLRAAELLIIDDLMFIAMPPF